MQFSSTMFVLLQLDAIYVRKTLNTSRADEAYVRQ